MEATLDTQEPLGCLSRNHFTLCLQMALYGRHTVSVPKSESKRYHLTLRNLSQAFCDR